MEAKLKNYLSLGNYNNQKYIYQDINDVLKCYQGFNVNLELFENSEKLINLSGAVCVKCNNIKYDIPVCIWLLIEYPYCAPVCFVIPPAQMKIKPSKFIDDSGKIHLPYLNEWKRNEHNLLGLVQILIHIFCEEVPVTAVSSPSSTSHRRSYSPPPVYSATPPTAPLRRLRRSNTSVANQLQNIDRLTVTEEHLHVSLVTAITDKLKRSFKEVSSLNDMEIENIKQINTQLQDGKRKLENINSSLETEIVQFQHTIKELKDKELDLNNKLKHLIVKNINYDEFINPTTPLYKQILDTHSEEAAIEDTMYYLSESLRQGVIDLDTYLKQIRSLSTKQFMLKTLINTCREKAGLN